MKKHLMLVPLAVAAMFATSCRTVAPLDPMTLKLSCRCLPENFRATGLDCGPEIEATK